MVELDEDSKSAIKTTGAVLKDCLDTGVYQKLKVTPALAALVQFGVAVKTVVEANEENKGEAALKAIDEIADKLDEIDRKMKENFDDLKAFVGQYSFYNDVPLVSALLSRYAAMVMKEPTPLALEKLREKYEAFLPVEYARRLNHQLSKTTTNPLKLLMAADPLNGKKTFEKWQANYESVLIQLYIIEACALKWFNDSHTHRMELIENECTIFSRSIQRWNDEYNNSGKHWPDLITKVVEEVLGKKDPKDTVDSKAKSIAEKLENILTPDMFYVLVLPESMSYIYHENQTNQMLVYGKNGYTVIVYRSLKAHGVEKSELQRGLYSLYQYRDRTVTGQEINKHYWFTQEDMKQFATRHYTGFPDCGAILAAKAKKDEVGVAWTGAGVHKNGCGDYGYGKVMQYDMWGIKHETASFFFAGYK